MVYIFENLSLCTGDWLENREKTLPAWRRKKVRSLKKEEDKIRSVAVFLLLERALRDLGISAVPEFAYERWGKPYLPGCSIHFSLSHCKSAVVCAVGDGPIGVDAQDEIEFSSKLADRICGPEESASLAAAEDPGKALTALWTKKESLAKKSGKGLGERFFALEGEVFTLPRPGYYLSVTEENPRICILNEL